MASGDIKLVYAASVDLTMTLASLASDANFLAGQESTEVDNTTNLYDDYLISGFITTGTTPTVNKEIRVYVVGKLNDATWPDVFDGTNSAETITNAGIRDSALALAGNMKVTATSNVAYPFRPISVRALFGGTLPKKFSVFVVHDTVAALHATGGNHVISITGVYENVAA